MHTLSCQQNGLKSLLFYYSSHIIVFWSRILRNIYFYYFFKLYFTIFLKFLKLKENYLQTFPWKLSIKKKVENGIRANRSQQKDAIERKWSERACKSREPKGEKGKARISVQHGQIPGGARHRAETLPRWSRGWGRRDGERSMRERGQPEKSVYSSKRRWKKCSRKAPREGFTNVVVRTLDAKINRHELVYSL